MRSQFVVGSVSRIDISISIMSVSVLAVFVFVKKILQYPFECFECGPLLGSAFPAVEHDLVQAVGTIGWLGHTVGSGYLLEYFLVAHAWIWRATMGYDLG